MRSAVLLSPLLLVAIAGCGGGKAAPAAPSAAPAAAVAVHAVELQPSPFDDELEVTGRVEAKQRVRITAEIAGRVEGLPFDDGARVGKGQAVARINARIAEAQVAQAQAAHDLARSTAERTTKLHKDGLATEQQLETARAQAAQAAAALELALAGLEKAVIRSPIDGVVDDVRIEKGEVAAPGVPLLEVLDLSAARIVADVPEQDVPLLSEGGAVQVTVDALAGRALQGTIARVGLSANSATRTFPVEVLVDNADRAIRPGMLARLIMPRQRLDSAVVAPRDAIIDEVDGKSAFVVEGGVAKKRAVDVGAIRGRYAHVRSGLAHGDVLIVLGHRQVVDGQKVDVKQSGACCKDADTTASLER